MPNRLERPGWIQMSERSSQTAALRVTLPGGEAVCAGWQATDRADGDRKSVV